MNPFICSWLIFLGCLSFSSMIESCKFVCSSPSITFSIFRAAGISWNNPIISIVTPIATKMAYPRSSLFTTEPSLLNNKFHSWKQPYATSIAPEISQPIQNQRAPLITESNIKIITLICTITQIALGVLLIFEIVLMVEIFSNDGKSDKSRGCPCKNG